MCSQRRPKECSWSDSCSMAVLYCSLFVIVVVFCSDRCNQKFELVRSFKLWMIIMYPHFIRSHFSHIDHVFSNGSIGNHAFENFRRVFLSSVDRQQIANHECFIDGCVVVWFCLCSIMVHVNVESFRVPLCGSCDLTNTYLPSQLIPSSRFKIMLTMNFHQIDLMTYSAGT